jgi:hypothetical protein
MLLYSQDITRYPDLPVFLSFRLRGLVALLNMAPRLQRLSAFFVSWTRFGNADASMSPEKTTTTPL